MTRRKLQVIAASLAAVPAIAGCKDAPSQPRISLPPIEQLLATTEGCDPDWLPARHCFVFPLSDVHETLVRSVGSWAGVRDRIAKRGVRSIDVARDGAPFETLLFDAQGRLIGEKGLTDPMVDWQVEYAADGSVRRFEELAGTQPASHPRKLGDVCAVVSAGVTTTVRACRLDGERLVRQTGEHVVAAKHRNGRIDFDLGGHQVHDAQGRLTERREGGLIQTFEYAQGVTRTTVVTAGQAQLEETIELDASGLPTKQVFHSATPPVTLTFEYKPDTAR